VTGLDYAINRHYDSLQGRFTQVDPIGMKSVDLKNPQTLNLYAYCANDPINHTDPDGLSFFSFFKRLFRGVGQIFSAVGAAVAKVLNNRWVRIGVFIASLLIGISAVVNLLGKAVTAAIQAALKIHNIFSNIATLAQMAGEVLQGHWKQLGIYVAMAYIGGVVSVIQEYIKRSVIAALTKNGKFSLGNFSFKKFFGGVWEGLKSGWSKVVDNFTQRDEWWQKILPTWGNYCGPGLGRGGPPNNGPPLSGSDPLCGEHDLVYNNRPSSAIPSGKKLDADLFLLWGMIRTHSSFNVIDLAVGGGRSADLSWRFFAIPVFSGIAVYRGVK